MNVNELFRSIGTAPPAPVMLMCPGKTPRAKDATFEPFLVEQAIEAMVAAYVDPSMKDLAYAAFYADETKPEEIVLEAQTLPFLAERRVILVRNAERYSSEAQAGALVRYLEDPCPSTFLVLVSSRVDKRTKFYKLCDKAGLVIESPALREDEVLDWLRQAVHQRNKRMDGSAARELVQRAGTCLSDVNNALNVVCGYVGDADVIRQEDVAASCADVAEEEVWALTDAIASSKSEEALKALWNLQAYGKHEDEILGIINWMLKSAYTVAQGENAPRQVSSFVAKKMRPLAEKLGVQKIRDAFALCTDTHFMIRSTGVDSRLAMELLVIKLSAGGRRGRAG